MEADVPPIVEYRGAQDDHTVISGIHPQTGLPFKVILVEPFTDRRRIIDNGDINPQQIDGGNGDEPEGTDTLGGSIRPDIASQDSKNEGTLDATEVKIINGQIVVNTPDTPIPSNGCVIEGGITACAEPENGGIPSLYFQTGTFHFFSVGSNGELAPSTSNGAIYGMIPDFFIMISATEGERRIFSFQDEGGNTSRIICWEPGEETTIESCFTNASDYLQMLNYGSQPTMESGGIVLNRSVFETKETGNTRRAIVYVQPTDGSAPYLQITGSEPYNLSASLDTEGKVLITTESEVIIEDITFPDPGELADVVGEFTIGSDRYVVFLLSSGEYQISLIDPITGLPYENNAATLYIPSEQQPDGESLDS